MPNVTGGPLWFLQDNTPEIVELLHKQVGKAVRKAALDIQSRAMASLHKGHGVDTGFMKSSIYVVTAPATSGKGYGEALDGDGPLLPPVASQPENDQTAYVAVGAEYGMYVEYGTANMAPIPYFTPAFDAVVPTFLEGMRRIEDGFPLFKTGALGTMFPGTEE